MANLPAAATVSGCRHPTRSSAAGQDASGCTTRTAREARSCRTVYAQPKCFMTASIPLCSWSCSALVSGAWSQYAPTKASRTSWLVGPQSWKVFESAVDRFGGARSFPRPSDFHRPARRTSDPNHGKRARWPPWTQRLLLVVTTLLTGQLPSLRPHAAKSQRRHSQGCGRSLVRAERSSALARVTVVNIVSSAAARLSISSGENADSALASDFSRV